MWNVKVNAGDVVYLKGRDLIDTLWNVKYSQFVDRSTGELDLIDTLWNVKVKIAAASMAGLAGFNRYIVECKEERDGSNDRSETLI